MRPAPTSFAKLSRCREGVETGEGMLSACLGQLHADAFGAEDESESGVL